ncbi:hypothetical protein AB1E18_006623 [Capra hircus]
MAGNLSWVAGCNLWDQLFHITVTLLPPKWVYDNVGILGNFEKHPKELIKGAIWRMVRNRMFTDELHNLNRLISYLYKCFN